MGKTTQKEKTTESKAALPEYQQAFSRVLAKANPTIDEEWEDYGGDLVADISDDESAAFGRLRGNEGDVGGFFDQAGGMARDGSQRIYGRQPMLDDDVTTGLGRKSYGWLDDATSDGPQYSQESLQQYMDPYLTGVLGTTLDWMGRSDAQAQDELTGNAIAKGAWGGDRAGLAKADLARSQGDQRAKTIASITSDAFRNAQDQFGKTRDADAQRRNRLLSAAGQGFNTFGDESARRTGVLAGDQDRMLRGASTVADIGQGRQNTTLNNLNALISAGRTQRDNKQNKLTSAYDQYQKKKDFSRKNLDWMANLSTGLSSAAGGTGTTEKLTPGPNILSQLAGLAMAGAKIASGMPPMNRGGVVKGDPLTRVLARFGLADGGPVLSTDERPGAWSGPGQYDQAPPLEFYDDVPPWDPKMSQEGPRTLEEFMASLNKPSSEPRYEAQKDVMRHGMAYNRAKAEQREHEDIDRMAATNDRVRRLVAEKQKMVDPAATGFEGLIRRAIAKMAEPAGKDLSGYVERARAKVGKQPAINVKPTIDRVRRELDQRQLDNATRVSGMADGGSVRGKMSDADRVGGRAANILDAALLGYGDEALGFLQSPADEQRALLQFRKLPTPTYDAARAEAVRLREDLQRENHQDASIGQLIGFLPGALVGGRALLAPDSAGLLGKKQIAAALAAALAMQTGRTGDQEALASAPRETFGPLNMDSAYGMADGGYVTVTPDIRTQKARANAKFSDDLEDWGTIAGLMGGKTAGIGMRYGGILGDDDDDLMSEPDGDADDGMMPQPAQAPQSIVDITPEMQPPAAAPVEKPKGFYDRMVESDDLPLLLMGLHMMAGQSPDALTNISQGILAGHEQTQSLRGAREKRANDKAMADARKLAADAASKNADATRTYKLGALGARQKEADARAAALAARTGLDGQRLGLDRERMEADRMEKMARVRDLQDQATQRAADLERAGRRDEAARIRNEAEIIKALTEASAGAGADDPVMQKLNAAKASLVDRIGKTPVKPDAASMPRLTSPEQVKSLPPGTWFIDPENNVRRSRE